MDIWSKEKRSEVMAKIRSKNTEPEMMLRKALFAKGFCYRINYNKLSGKPDIVFPKYKTVIFVHGCFWHGHDNCKIAHIPKSNTEFWEHKIMINQERDKSNEMKIVSSGWKALTFWECEIPKKTIESVLESIIATLHRNIPHPYSTRIRLYEEREDNIMMVAEDIVPYGQQKQLSYQF
ncbi:MAG: very short patch repair endonuclease [Bacteroidales bacterium]|jgi:DNA mismatch endonuclease (patch repair protein)|nr:very short patch repair endonuclease [Bacteroidales bacterium]